MKHAMPSLDFTFDVGCAGIITRGSIKRVLNHVGGVRTMPEPAHRK